MDVVVSIIILTKNAGNRINHLLRKIYEQKFNGKYEVIIIDSGSSDETLAIAKDFCDKIIKIKPEHFHHGRTRNLGAHIANGKFLVYITQDALPLKDDWLQKLINNFCDPKVAAVYGRQIPWDDTIPPEKFFYHYHFPNKRLVLRYQDATNKLTLNELVKSCYNYDYIFISDVNAAIRKSVWNKFKFSETILTAEDKEFARRVLLNGYKIIYEPDAIVYHAHRFSLSSLFHKHFEFGIALSHGSRISSKSYGKSIIKVFRYFLAEIDFLRKKGYIKWVPYAFIYDFHRFLGLFLGQRLYTRSRLLKSVKRGKNN